MISDQSTAIPALVIVSLTCGLVSFCPSPVAAQAPTLHGKWEYQAVEFYAHHKASEHARKLNELSAQGWEFVGMIHPLNDGGGRFAPKSAVAFRRARKTVASAGDPSDAVNAGKSSELAERPGAVEQRQSNWIQLRFADAAKVEAILSGLNHPNVSVGVDRRTNRIVIEATEPQHQELAALIEQLDSQKRSETLTVIPLRKLDRRPQF